RPALLPGDPGGPGRGRQRLGQPATRLQAIGSRCAGRDGQRYERYLDAQPVPRLARVHVLMSARPTIADIVRFVKHEARLLDEKRFEEWYELFTDDAHYWVPAVHGQTDPKLQNSLAHEDRLRIRLKRVDILNCDAMLPSIQLFL